nr:MAG TPA: hypothetical protein [Caudoviricetes sp.]
MLSSGLACKNVISEHFCLAFPEFTQFKLDHFNRTLVLTMINKPNETQYSSYTVNIYF